MQSDAKEQVAKTTRKDQRFSSLRSCEVKWQDIAIGSESRTTIRLRGLPRPLCAPRALEKLLQTSRLLDQVDFIHVVPGPKVGSAILNAKSVANVPGLVRFFHGKQMGRTPPMAVSFANAQGLDALHQTFQRGARAGAEASKLQQMQPQRIDFELYASEGGHSEISTEVSTAEEAETTSTSENGTCPCPPMMPGRPCRVILPPPGLSKPVQLACA